MDSFFRRLDDLRKLVGDGDLKGEVTVDQSYALAQHERTDYAHPKGGEAKYLENPLKEKHDLYWRAIADDLLGRGPENAMVKATEDLVGEVGRRAPIEEGILRTSASPSVYDGMRRVYHRPPESPREGR